MKLAIKGHATRGKEVIKTLEMLGGVNSNDAFGDLPNNWNVGYYIFDGVISVSEVEILAKKEFKIYTLEEFLEKFPYKVGDKVQYKGATSCGSIFEVEEMRWEENTVKYTLCLFGCNYKRSTLPVEYLQPYKEETMEEPKELLIGFIKDKDGNMVLNTHKDYEIKEVDGKFMLLKKKPQYPKTYGECCNVLGYDRNLILGTMPMKYQVLINFQKLLICRDTYWKIAGEQMGLGRPWKPDWNDLNRKYFISLTCDGIGLYDDFRNPQVLAFPTEEMRDAFYENFKDLIEQCKELL